VNVFCILFQVRNQLPYAIEVFYMANAGTEAVPAGFVEPTFGIRLPCQAAVLAPYELRFKPQMAGYIHVFMLIVYGLVKNHVCNVCLPLF
jgi:hypothetical protein